MTDLLNQTPSTTGSGDKAVEETEEGCEVGDDADDPHLQDDDDDDDDGDDDDGDDDDPHRHDQQGAHAEEEPRADWKELDLLLCLHVHVGGRGRLEGPADGAEDENDSVDSEPELESRVVRLKERLEAGVGGGDRELGAQHHHHQLHHDLGQHLDAQLVSLER